VNIKDNDNLLSLLQMIVGDQENGANIASLLDQVFRYGRPLWSTYLDSSTAVDPVSSLIDIGTAKLLGGINLQRAMKDSLETSSVIALWGVRVCPWIIPQSELASTLVAQNLGICLHVDQSRKFLFMGYPSE